MRIFLAVIFVVSTGLLFGQPTNFYTPSLGPYMSHIHYGPGDWYIRSAASSGKVIIQDTGGNVGIGTATPSAKLHVLDGASSSNATNVTNGNLLIQANTGTRSTTLGAQLEFVIPANTDGSNLWGQGRIITVAGNTSSAASGKMILGTRRWFDKGVGTGHVWNYGDDIVIDDVGKVGIGTATPSAKLHVLDGPSSSNATQLTNGNLIIQANTGTRSTTLGAQLEFVIPANVDGSNLYGQGRIITVAGNTNNATASGKMILGTRRWFDKGVGTGLSWNYGDDIVIDDVGKVGIGTATPSAKLHVLDGPSSSNATQLTNGNLIIQANTGTRSTTLGAQLEFVIPANVDGSNLYGQGRIITVAGNTNNATASGKMILGTRRWFDKGVGTGLSWNYGDDIVIDDMGRVGIGTSSPDAALAVKGTIHSREVKVDMLGAMVPDYVFENYNLPSLDSIKTYIDQHKHLPEIPSAKDMEANGVNLGEMNMLLLKKMEEMTLYVIEMNNKIDKLKNENHSSNTQIKRLEEEINQLKK